MRKLYVFLIACLLLAPVVLAARKEWKSVTFEMYGNITNEKKLVYNGNFTGRFCENVGLHMCYAGSGEEINGTYTLDLKSTEFGPSSCILKIAMGKKKITSSCDVNFDDFGQFLGWVDGSVMKGFMIQRPNMGLQTIVFFGTMKV